MIPYLVMIDSPWLVLIWFPYLICMSCIAVMFRILLWYAPARGRLHRRHQSWIEEAEIVLERVVWLRCQPTDHECSHGILEEALCWHDPEQKWRSMAMCFMREWKTGFTLKWVGPILSHRTTGLYCKGTPSSVRSDLIQASSEVAWKKGLEFFIEKETVVNGMLEVLEKTFSR